MEKKDDDEDDVVRWKRNSKSVGVRMIRDSNDPWITGHSAVSSHDQSAVLFQQIPIFDTPFLADCDRRLHAPSTQEQKLTNHDLQTLRKPVALHFVLFSLSIFKIRIRTTGLTFS